MCGVFFSNSSNHHSSEKISESLQLRGPDGSETLKIQNSIIHFTRLAIRDLEGGSQPYESNDSNYICAINGELYNESQIKESLNLIIEANPTGDMQILAEYLCQDIRNLKNVEGMFAGFILDVRKQKLFFFRDKVGEKPLYYFLKNGEISVSSTLTAIVEYNNLEQTEVNLGSIYKGHDSPGETIFLGIKEVLPAQVVEFDLETGALSFSKYWSWPRRGTKHQNEVNLQTDFQNTLLNVVTTSALSDVPICMFLSGGLDSAAVLSALNMTQRVPVHAFTLAFENSSFNESTTAGLTAQALKSPHDIISVTDLEFAEYIQGAISKLDTPILDPAYLPLNLLSKKVKENFGFKVAITGDGGDELLRGYELFRIRRKIQIASRFPLRNILTQILGYTIPFLIDNEGRNSIQFQLARLESVLKNNFVPWYESALSPFAGTELFQTALQYSTVSNSESSSNLIFSAESVEKYYQEEILPQVYLRKSDNASMVNGVEIRVPLLHPKMIEFAMSISGQFLEQGLHKEIMRNYLSQILPPRVLSAKKRGFSVPLPGILRNIEMPQWNLEILNFKNDACAVIWKSGCKGDLNAARSAYALLVLNTYLNK